MFTIPTFFFFYQITLYKLSIKVLSDFDYAKVWIKPCFKTSLITHVYNTCIQSNKLTQQILNMYDTDFSFRKYPTYSTIETKCLNANSFV